MKDAHNVFGSDMGELPYGGRVLEIGCGIGRVILPLAEAYPHTQFFGVDVSTEMVRIANTRLRGHPNGLVFRTSGDLLDMFDDAYFDFVYSLMVFQHLPQPVFCSYAAEIVRILRPGGTLRFQVQYDESKNGQDPYPASDFRSIRYYDATALKRLFPSRLEIVAVHPANPQVARVHDYYVTAKRTL
ncbi:class I SAM-dependent methyltransferase [Haliangium sp.]|uniref:class I SAM-dependent methyltransferase n=1 Tax=Haliangium sp. TaxID=2663208 RepID=UPI003D143BD5